MNYHEIYRHYEDCFSEHGDNHKGMDWPNFSDAQTRYSVMQDVVKFCQKDSTKSSILDFGCGTGHFLDFLRSRNSDLVYSGCDISQMFIDQCRVKYPGISFFQADLLDGTRISDRYDFVCMNGVFTERRSLSNAEMWKFSTALLSKVFECVNYGVAVNFMTKNVDWEREDLFHLSLDRITQFVCKNLSRNYVIRSDYGLFEYTLYIYV
jgi:SAM-dependent methyltransferase